jgi:hypothetical protein
MQTQRIPLNHIRTVTEVVAIDKQEAADIFGEELPAGIILKEE